MWKCYLTYVYTLDILLAWGPTNYIQLGPSLESSLKLELNFRLEVDKTKARALSIFDLHLLNKSVWLVKARWYLGIARPGPSLKQLKARARKISAWHIPTINQQFDLKSFELRLNNRCNNYHLSFFLPYLNRFDRIFLNYYPRPSLCVWIHFPHHYGHVTTSPEQSNIHVQMYNDIFDIVSSLINLI
jgi:hypothetical protein